MPIYEFICESCGNEFEQIRSFSDSSMPACAKCGSEQVARRMGRPAIHFKGSGWYITDSKKSGDTKSSNSGSSVKSSSESTKSESSTTESSTTSTSESKSETKSAPAPVASSD